MSHKNVKNALFVCFGGMSNVGALTGLAAIQVIEQLEPGKASIFCLGGLPTGAPLVMNKTESAERIITIDGCPLNCAKKIVEAVGFTPKISLTLTEDCQIKKGPLSSRTADDQRVVVKAIMEAIEK